MAKPNAGIIKPFLKTMRATGTDVPAMLALFRQHRDEFYDKLDADQRFLILRNLSKHIERTRESMNRDGMDDGDPFRPSLLHTVKEMIK
jgi:hypothetical protein